MRVCVLVDNLDVVNVECHLVFGGVFVGFSERDSSFVGGQFAVLGTTVCQ